MDVNERVIVGNKGEHITEIEGVTANIVPRDTLEGVDDNQDTIDKVFEEKVYPTITNIFELLDFNI